MMWRPTFPTDVSPSLKAHIKASERLMLRAYFDPVGVPTVGWGHTKTVTAADVRRGLTISELDAERLFEADLDEAEMAVWAHTKVSLNQNQYDSLTDFVFNLGAGNYRKSTLLKKLNAGDYASVPTELMRWTKARDRKTGKLRELGGLTTRRKWEADLFNTPVILGPKPPVQPGNSTTTIQPSNPDKGKTTLWDIVANLIAIIITTLFGGRK